jgi:hypothetical protein
MRFLARRGRVGFDGIGPTGPTGCGAALAGAAVWVGPFDVTVNGCAAVSAAALGARLGLGTSTGRWRGSWGRCFRRREAWRGGAGPAQVERPALETTQFDTVLTSAAG